MSGQVCASAREHYWRGYGDGAADMVQADQPGHDDLMDLAQAVGVVPAPARRPCTATGRRTDGTR